MWRSIRLVASLSAALSPEVVAKIIALNSEKAKGRGADYVARTIEAAFRLELA
jgi:hypothetical protein